MDAENGDVQSIDLLLSKDAEIECFADVPSQGSTVIVIQICLLGLFGEVLRWSDEEYGEGDAMGVQGAHDEVGPAPVEVLQKEIGHWRTDDAAAAVAQHRYSGDQSSV